MSNQSPKPGQEPIKSQETPPATKQSSSVTIPGPYVFQLPADLSVHQQAIYQELNWFAQVLYHRFKNPQDTTALWNLPQKYPGEEGQPSPLQAPYIDSKSHYGQLLNQYQLGEEARLLLALGVAIHLNQILLLPLVELAQYPGTYPLIGGELTNQKRRFQPSSQTFLFLVAGADVIRQGQVQYHFQVQHPLIRDEVIQLRSFRSTHTDNQEAYDEWLYKRIILHKDYYHYFMGGQMPRPEDNKNLPLTKLDTSLTFEDLVLPTQTRHDLKPLLDYAQNGQAIFNDAQLSSGFKKGYIALLYGAPGTGKTLIATTIGKKLGLVTYQLELAQTVSKYIGETSKNINQVFQELERTIEHLKGKPSILFIDEADALVGKRSEVKDSKDRYANMDVSNLLQKLEGFPGLVIMASNFQQNFDPAIKRRIDSFVQIPQPEASQRAELWKRYLPAHLQYPTPDFAQQLGEKFRLTGAQINNIMKQVLITTYSQGIDTVDFEHHLEPAIKKEYIKNEEVYNRPNGLDTGGHIKQDIIHQALWWQEVLPQDWQYIPPYLPSVLGHALILDKDTIQQVVLEAKSRWEGGEYTYLPFRDGIEGVLREVCLQQGMNWSVISQTIERLMKEATDKNNRPDIDQAHEAPEEPATSINPQNTAAQKQEKGNYIPSFAKAPVYWEKSIPSGFEFARKDLSKNLAQFLKNWSVGQMESLLREAAKFAEAEGSKKISYTRHLGKAFDSLGLERPTG